MHTRTIANRGIPEQQETALFVNLLKPDEMRRPVSERDAVRSQVIDVLEAQEIKETGNEKG